MTLQQRAVEQQFVSNRVSQWTTALNNAAQDTLASLYEDSPNLRVVWPDGSAAIGFEENERAIADIYDQWEMVNYGPISPEVHIISAEVAMVTFGHSLDIQFVNSRRQVSSGHTTLVFVKDAADGLWKIRRQHMSVNPIRSISGR
jgi:ketosteroid isomerase-like protein